MSYIAIEKRKKPITYTWPNYNCLCFMTAFFIQQKQKIHSVTQNAHTHTKPKRLKLTKTHKTLRNKVEKKHIYEFKQNEKN